MSWFIAAIIAIVAGFYFNVEILKYIGAGMILLPLFLVAIVVIAVMIILRRAKKRTRP